MSINITNSVRYASFITSKTKYLKSKQYLEALIRWISLWNKGRVDELWMNVKLYKIAWNPSKMLRRFETIKKQHGQMESFHYLEKH